MYDLPSLGRPGWELSPIHPLVSQFVARFDPRLHPTLIIAGNCANEASALADAARHAYRLTVMTDNDDAPFLRIRLDGHLPDPGQRTRITCVTNAGVLHEHSVDGYLCLRDAPFDNIEAALELFREASRILRQSPKALFVLRAQLPAAPQPFADRTTVPFTGDGKTFADIEALAVRNRLHISHSSRFDNTFMLVLTRPPNNN